MAHCMASPPQISLPFDFVRNVLSGAWEGLPASATRHLPVRTLDSILTGGPIPFFQVGRPSLRGYWAPPSSLAPSVTTGHSLT